MILALDIEMYLGVAFRAMGNSATCNPLSDVYMRSILCPQI